MPDKLDEIAARLAKATPGPWRIVEFNGELTVRNGCPVATICDAYSPEQMTGNADLIANSPTDLAYLLARLKAAEAVCEAAESCKEQDMSVPFDHDYAVWEEERHRRIERIFDALTIWQEARDER